MRSIKFIVTIVFVGVIGLSFSQEVINTTGGSTMVGTTYYDFNIGETVIATGTSANLVITQGLLQPTQLATGINNNQLTANDFLVYPNPTQFEINLKNNFRKATVNYTLIDEAGKVVLNSQSIEIEEGNIQKIDVQQLATGNYFLKVEVSVNEEKYNGTYKVLKIK